MASEAEEAVAVPPEAADGVAVVEIDVGAGAVTP